MADRSVIVLVAVLLLVLAIMVFILGAYVLQPSRFSDTNVTWALGAAFIMGLVVGTYSATVHTN